MAERQVIIRGKIFLYKQKAPFVASGFSFQGAIEYDAESDKIRCHECGRWFRALTSHLKTDGISAREYKLKHGLTGRTALCNEATRVSISRSSAARGIGEKMRRVRLEALRTAPRPTTPKHHYECRNERNKCAAQLIECIRLLARKLGRTPSEKDLLRAGISHASALHVLNVRDMASLMTLADLTPNMQGGVHYTPEVLIEMVRDFIAAHGRLPRGTDLLRKLLPSRQTFNRNFGGLRKACIAAGFGKVAA
jgi:hypothetical protein